jgi:hypothetical protein
MDMNEFMKSFVEDIVKNLVDKQDEVTIDIFISTKAISVQIKTAKEDCGKVIGRKGRTIDAIKILTLAAKNTKFPEDSKTVSIEISEEENVSIKKTTKANWR